MGTPNIKVDIAASWLSLDQKLVISRVDYLYFESDGEICNFTVTHASAFLPEKFRKSKKRAAATRRARSSGRAARPAFYAGMTPG